MSRLRGFLIATLVSVAACSGVSPATPEQPFAGSWRWVRSQGGIAGVEITPATEGYVIRLEFDGLGGVRAYRNDTLIATAGYTALERLEHSGVAWEVTYDPELPAFLFDVLDLTTARRTGDVLILADPCCDRWVHTLEDAR